MAPDIAAQGGGCGRTKTNAVAAAKHPKQAIVEHQGAVHSTSHPSKNMKLSQLLLAPVALAALLAFTPSEGVVGKSMPALPIEGLAQTKAKSIDDFAGRAVLVEFFAFW